MATNKMAYEELKYAEFLALMYRSDCQEVIDTEHKRVISEEVEGTFSAEQQNRSLNRFGHNVCFDHSRVILPKERNGGNYINANYVDGFEHTKKFICAEAPTRNTCYDFYRMLWMEQVQIIVMLTQKKENGKEKCYPYWREEEQTSFRLGKFEITTTNVEQFFHYVKSTLELTDGTGVTQTVILFNFTAWPDHDVPKNTSEFVSFVLEVRRCQKELHENSLQNGHKRRQPPPIVVHCNAGLGRTPCYCVVDISITMFHNNQTVSIPSIVSNIRQKRYHSLFNPFQYFFCYEAVKFYLELDDTKALINTGPVRQFVSYLKNLIK